MTGAVIGQARVHYRPNIEGMCASAILLVIVAHTRVPGLEAGALLIPLLAPITLLVRWGDMQRAGSDLMEARHD